MSELPRQSAPEQDGPTTFDELHNGSDPKSVGCRRCGEPATHRAQISVRPKPPPRAGRGSLPVAVADHKTDLCERCAVQLFVQVRKAMR